MALSNFKESTVNITILKSTVIKTDKFVKIKSDRHHDSDSDDEAL